MHGGITTPFGCSNRITTAFLHHNLCAITASRLLSLHCLSVSLSLSSVDGYLVPNRPIFYRRNFIILPPLMAVLFHPRPFSGSLFSKEVVSATRTARFRFPASTLDLKPQCRAASDAGTAIVWYKHDLRIEDHPGLVAASHHSCVVPLYIFDRRILRRFSDEVIELLLLALEDLRKLLQEQGSNLMIRVGSAENVVAELVKEVKVSNIFVEEEVEYELQLMLDFVHKSLSTLPVPGGNPEIVMWRSPFYDVKSLSDVPWSFDDFNKLKLPVVSPITPPKLPVNATTVSWGTLPSLADLKEYMHNGDSMLKEWTSITTLSAENQLLEKLRRNLESKRTETEELSEQGSGSSKTGRRKKPEKSAFVTKQGNLVGGGSSVVLNALAGYLRYLEGTARYEWQEVHEKIRLTENREGASFGALFGSALLLGIISRRRVHFEAVKYEKERNGGFLSPFGYSTTKVAAAIDTVSSMEWYWLLTLKSQRNPVGDFAIRIWRWNNYLIEYTVAGHEGPAILLVHGFGACLEHYRDNIHPIAEAGNRVWAITLLGFGRSEKPNIVYTELVWAELIRDFIIDVVGEPAHIIGNSIGGYAVAIAAGLWPALAKSVILMNSAGNIVPGYSVVGYSDNRQISGAAWFGARCLLVYLRFYIRNILRSFYPTNTDRADDWLVNEMIRASHDPGAIFVLESIFSFDLSLPLNYLLEGVDTKVLVLQGMKDPLLDSKAKLAMFRKHCKGITVKEVNAGHCPHDELPNEVNLIIKQRVAALETE